MVTARTLNGLSDSLIFWSGLIGVLDVVRFTGGRHSHNERWALDGVHEGRRADRQDHRAGPRAGAVANRVRRASARHDEAGGRGDAVRGDIRPPGLRAAFAAGAGLGKLAERGGRPADRGFHAVPLRLHALQAGDHRRAPWPARTPRKPASKSVHKSCG